MQAWIEDDFEILRMERYKEMKDDYAICTLLKRN